MSDLSSNETLEPLENTNSNDAHVVDNTPEDWESIIDFEMKTGKKTQIWKVPTKMNCHLATYFQLSH